MLPGDTEETLHERIKEVERRLYPAAIRKVMTELDEGREAGGRERGGSVRALLSVYDKTGIVELAAGLSELGWELVSSGGTARAHSPTPACPWSRSPR